MKKSIIISKSDVVMIIGGLISIISAILGIAFRYGSSDGEYIAGYVFLSGLLPVGFLVFLIGLFLRSRINYLKKHPEKLKKKEKVNKIALNTNSQFQITSYVIDSVKECKSVSGVAMIGVGLWTSICVGCANVFGCQSKNYTKKVAKVKSIAEQRMFYEAEGFDGIMDVKYAISGLSVIVSGTAYKKQSL